jgi:hypothetical protein
VAATDGTTNNPSFNGGTILMTLTGLSEGPHTIITYHNAPWPAARYIFAQDNHCLF